MGFALYGILCLCPFLCDQQGRFFLKKSATRSLVLPAKVRLPLAAQVKQYSKKVKKCKKGKETHTHAYTNTHRFTCGCSCMFEFVYAGVLVWCYSITNSFVTAFPSFSSVSE